MTNFDILFKGKEKIGDGMYSVSSTKRLTLIVPKGCKVFDEGTNTWYYGDGSTAGGIEFYDSTATSTFQSQDITISDATPVINFKDTSCTDTDVNASIQADATDTGSGTEDVDVTLKQQVAGAATTFLNSDADGALTLGQSSQPITLNGVTTNSNAIYANGGVDCSTAASLSLGETNANAVSISKSGVTTTINGGFQVAQSSSILGTVTISGTMATPVTIGGIFSSGISVSGFSGCAISFYGTTGIAEASAAHASGVSVDASNFTSYLKCEVNGQTKYLWFSDVVPASMIHN